MELGIYFDMRNPPDWEVSTAKQYGRTLELIEQAEAWEMDYVWLSEHHFFEDGYLPQTLTMAAAIAARTKTIRIGTAVILAPLRPAIQIAEEAVIVDILSEGRLELGLGAGYVLDEFDAFGTSVSDRYKLCDQRVGEIRELWAKKITPKPIQEEIPIWLGYMGPKGAKRAGRLGCGLLHAGNLEPYLEGLNEGGHDISTAKMSGLIWILVSNDPESAYERVLPHTAYQLNSYGMAGLAGRKDRDGNQIEYKPITVEDLRKKGRKSKESRKNLEILQVLTPEEAIEYIQTTTKGLPVSEVHSWASIAGMPEDMVEEHIELMANQVRPQLLDFKPNPN